MKQPTIEELKILCEKQQIKILNIKDQLNLVLKYINKDIYAQNANHEIGGKK